MERLIGSELASIGRRFLTEFELAALSPQVQAALARLLNAEAAALTRAGPNAMRINGYI